MEDYGDKIVILGFPCNQFGLQEPGATPSEIINGVRYVRPGNNFITKIQYFKKVEVNGKNAFPLFKYLKNACPATRTSFAAKSDLFYEDLEINDLRWNFEKFIISKDGKLMERYDPRSDHKLMRPTLDKLLANK